MLIKKVKIDVERNYCIYLAIITIIRLVIYCFTFEISKTNRFFDKTAILVIKELNTCRIQMLV